VGILWAMVKALLPSSSAPLEQPVTANEQIRANKNKIPNNLFTIFLLGKKYKHGSSKR
jgi:hypothetical protein